MNRRLLSLALALTFLAAIPAAAEPRDAAAVLNRCGKPLKGEETILENTVAGGRRLLIYERGTLTFNKVANVGWTFAYGTHGKLDHLDAERMEKYMPCLKDALADSAAPEPLVIITPIERTEVSMRRSYKKLIIYTILFVILMIVLYVVISRRTRKPERSFDEEVNFDNTL